MASLGTLSSLGFSSGLLTQEKIDKMKEMEVKNRVNRYTQKIEENTTKQKDLTEIKTKLLTFQTAVSSLADSTAFAKRKVSASISDNPPASLSASSGVALQSMNVNVTQLAQKDVYQSKGFANDSGFINASLTKNADLTFFSNGKEYTVSIDKNTTYRGLADKINAATGGEIVAKIVNTGEKTDPYRLTLTSKETGEDHAISFYAGKKDGSGKYQEDNDAKEIFKKLGWELETSGGTIDPAKDKKGYGIKDDPNAPLHIQKAQNAEFTLDGIKMIRSSNTITDLGVGLTLTLNKTGEINFDVQQDNEAVSKTMQELADAYNDLVTNLNAATDYNSETGTKGTLQGINEISTIRSNILSVLFDSQTVTGSIEDKNGNKMTTNVRLSLQDFGLSLSDAGTLNFDSSKFEKKVKENQDLTESFFSNITKYEDINHTGELITTGSLNKYVSGGTGSGTSNGLEFKRGDFTIVYNNESYDVSKTASGALFNLTGTSEQDLLQNLATHINGLGIEGLSVKVEAYNKNNQTGWELKFSGDGGSDFSIKGNKDFLKQFGLSETSIAAKPIEGKGVFSKLKSTLQGMTGKQGSLTKYDESLTKENKDLEKIKKTTQESIDARYDTMTNQWLKYETILTKLNNQLKAVNSMINAAANNSN